jgi:hypothetical protein
MLQVLSPDLTDCFEQEIAAQMKSFSERDTSGKQSLQQMLASDREAFSKASILALARATGSAGTRYVLHLLRRENMLMDALLDPWRSKREEAVAAARMIPQAGIPIDYDLEGALRATLALSPSADNAARILRLLDVLEAASKQPRFSLFQTELLAYPSPGVRSRSTLLIASSSKNVSLVGRMMLDDDSRVQANAVEALWTFEPEDARPLLLTAARSKVPRVAGNAAVGLYRMGDLAGVQLLFSMGQESDKDLRTTAAWAMGETGDPRFLPFLTASFARSSGNERVNVLQALSRIRRREKSLLESGAIEIRTWNCGMDSHETRRLVVTLWSATRQDLSSMKATDFALWEGGDLVLDYQISGQNAALAISGFVLPRFSSMDDAYAQAVLAGIERCLKYKRSDDLWRLDRYLTKPRAGGAMGVIERACSPYDDSVLGASAKTQQRGFLADPDALRRILESPGSKERAADSVVAAFERQSDAMIKFGGKHRLFLFLPPQGGGRLDHHAARLTSFVANERITLHGIAPKGEEDCQEFQELCLASEGGTFARLAPEDVAGEVERLYAQSVNRFDVTYRVPERKADGLCSGEVQITGNYGCGRAEFSFARMLTHGGSVV